MAACVVPKLLVLPGQRNAYMRRITYCLSSHIFGRVPKVECDMENVAKTIAAISEMKVRMRNK